MAERSSPRFRRRNLLRGLGTTFLFPLKALANAAGRKEQPGIGSVRLEGPASVEVLSHQTWRLIYTAGPGGMAAGSGIRIAMRHLQRQTAMPQTADPQGANFLSATADGDLPLKIDVPNGWKVFMTQYFPWQNIVQVTLPQGGLEPDRTLQVTFGDRSGGGLGMKVQPFDESHYELKCYVDVSGEGNYLPIEKSPTIRVVAAEPAKLAAVTPSDAVVGEPIWCIVRAEDRYGNPAPRFRGTVRLSSTDPAELPPPHAFTAEDRGVFRFEGIKFSRPGIQRLHAHVADSVRTTTNPVRVAAKRPAELLLWGDLHGHTLFSDGRGTVEEYYDVARRVVGLDFCAVSDHAFELLDEMWTHSKAVTNRLNRPGEFVTFNGYEWSGATPVGGDHNVYFLDDDPPLFRSTTMYDRRNLQMDHRSEKVGTVEQLMARLARLLTDKNVLCIPHFGGRRGNPRWHDERVQRLIEIFSDHRRSEPWAETFLAAGHRLGIMASTDNHYGNPGYGYLKILDDWQRQEIGTSAMAVYASDRTRRSIFHAMYDRRTYATSGPRILLDVRADDRPMGSELRTQQPPVIAVDAVGTAPIARVEIKKNGQSVHTAASNDEAVELEWQDPKFAPDRPAYYNVRIVQTDGEEAISSPIWVN
ncbi:MAG: CehA/McbA family metallohydrolase [Candidatus Nealsonbacteria bacterium]|nr:CehA/McbA family metallohydrolase [Candidatus Nealsonbacteria bacterium]